MGDLQRQAGGRAQIQKQKGRGAGGGTETAADSKGDKMRHNLSVPLIMGVTAMDTSTRTSTKGDDWIAPPQTTKNRKSKIKGHKAKAGRRAAGRNR